MPLHAYELATHGMLTYKAYQCTVLADPGFQDILGIENGKTPFGDDFYDVRLLNWAITGEDIFSRKQDTFERRIISTRLKESIGAIEPSSIEGWLMTGAIREDDNTKSDNGQPVNDPHDENANLERPLYHFYDPVDPLNRGSALYVGCPFYAQYNCVRQYAPDLRSAPDWAIGTLDAFTWMNEPESGRRNHFTLFDAREALYRALTGHKKAGAEAATTSEERNAYWATTFRALGDVVHLVEDMAQPQHTRDDPQRIPEEISRKTISKRVVNA